MRIAHIAVVFLAVTCSTGAEQDASASRESMPEVVVQRFVDAANARNVDAMAALVAADAVFAGFRKVRSWHRIARASGLTTRGFGLGRPSFVSRSRNALSRGSS